MTFSDFFMFSSPSKAGEIGIFGDFSIPSLKLFKKKFYFHSRTYHCKCDYREKNHMKYEDARQLGSITILRKIHKSASCPSKIINYRHQELLLNIQNYLES